MYFTIDLSIYYLFLCVCGPCVQILLVVEARNVITTRVPIKITKPQYMVCIFRITVRHFVYSG